MFLHRIIAVAGFAADTDWATTQAEPPNELIPTGGRRVEVPHSGTLYWYAIGYDGNSPTASKPVTGAGFTVDARLVYVVTPTFAGSSKPYVAHRPSAGERFGGAIKLGREVVEADLPVGAAGTLQMLSLTGTPGPTHVWLFWSFTQRR